MGTAPACAREALDMVLAGLSYLAAADATQLSAEAQAECLRGLERTDAISTAVRASFLAAFTVGRGYSADADVAKATAQVRLINNSRLLRIGLPFRSVGGIASRERLGFRLIRSTIQEQRRGRQRRDNFAPACRSELRYA